MSFYGGYKNYNNGYNKSCEDKKSLLTEKEIKYYEALRDLFKQDVLKESPKVKMK